MESIEPPVFLSRALLWLVTVVSVSVASAGIAPRSPPSARAGAVPLVWPASPTPEAIFALSLFSEPLVPVGGVPSLEANRLLVDSLKRYASRSMASDVSSITDYLKTYPSSPWAAALWVNLGQIYYRGGFFSLALDAWGQAWQAGREDRTPRGKALVDRAVGELARMHARIGHVEQLTHLMAELEGRELTGSPAEAVRGAREGLWMMEHEPGVSFLCGPMALKNVLQSLNPQGTRLSVIEDARSAPGGFSLQQVQDLAQTAGLRYRMARRKPGARLPLPVVAHWKVDHYAALVGEQNGLYHLKDPTFGNDLWISQAALDHEASGYFLIADNGVLPDGWEAVSAEEARTVHGMGFTASGDDSATGQDDESVPSSCPTGENGMARHDFISMLASLRVRDTPLRYVPGVGPEVPFTVTYNQREAGQPANFNFSNLGSRWSHNWMAYVVDRPSNLLSDVTLVRAGGGYNTFTGFDEATRNFGVEVKSQARLTRTKDSPAVYRRLLPDGSQEVYAENGPIVGDERQVFLSQVVDPQGNAVKLDYDRQRRLRTLTDATGKVTRFVYRDPADAFKISQVIDPAGRTATLTYDYVDPAGLPCDPTQRADCSAGRLNSVTDPVGIVSAFRYRAGSDFMTALDTPYGTTTFESGASYTPEAGPARWVLATDPLGNRERIEFRQNAPGIAFSDVSTPQGMTPVPFNAYMNGRNSFFWNKKAAAQACRFGATTRCDYSRAQIFHWLHGGPGASVTQGVLESEKKPLEGRVWYTYPGQTDWAGVIGTIDRPTGVGRLLDDGSTRLEQYSYNAIGQVTRAVDPVGRTRFYEYAPNQIDLLRVWQRIEPSCDVLQGVTAGCDLLEEFTYNGRHRMLTHADASGAITRFAYNAWGQLTRVTNALDEVTRYRYVEDPASASYRRLAEAVRDGKVVARYTYDAAGRVRSASDAGGYRRVYTYDGLDRVTRVTYPDGTTERYGYERLDLVIGRDRLARTTAYEYNALGQLTKVTYPKRPGEPERTLGLEWCGCGVLERLTDGEGHVTRWSHDLQGRVTGKFLPGNSSALPDESYAYEAGTGLLKSQSRQGSPGPELRTEFRYHPDDQLKSIVYDAGSIKPNATIGAEFNYDPAYPRLASFVDAIGTTAITYHLAGSPGAGQVREEDGPWPNDTIRYGYDALGRLVSRAIDGKGRLQRRYDALGRVTEERNPLGTFALSYVGATERLEQLDTQLPGSALTGLRSVYAYNGNTRDRTLRRIEHWVGNAEPKRLLSAFESQWDAVGNLTGWAQAQQGQVARDAAYTFDALDQLVGVAPSTPAAGSAYAYAYDRAGNRIEETVDGVTITENSNSRNQLVQRGEGGSYEYDAGGNTRSDSAHDREFVWDGADRLVSMVDAGNNGKHSDFAYDALGRLRVIREYANGVLSSEKRYVWCGVSRCEERDDSDAVLKRYYDQGETRSALALYYSRDHLGSVRELTTATGTLRAQYAYDPWGRVTKLAGNLEADLRYTGYFHHRESDLTLAPFRAYSSDTGRWLSPDPIREVGGLNLYGYVGNNPVSRVDPLGLCDGDDQPPPWPTKPEKDWGPLEHWQAWQNFMWHLARGFTNPLNQTSGASSGNATGQ